MAIFFFSGKRPEAIGIQGARLSPCPPSPNCVCSDDRDGKHAVAPLALAVSPVLGWEAARHAVMQLPRTRIVTDMHHYLHAECSSALLGFVDDLELHWRPEAGIIAVRSASRRGRFDFGVNRRRVETLRALLGSKNSVR